MNVKKKLSLLASSAIVLAAQSSAALAQFGLDNLGLDCNVCPYVGADVAWRHMEFARDYGGKLIKKNYPQGNVYAGLKFNEYFGIEGGFESTTSVRRTANLLSNDPAFFGQSIGPFTSLNTFITTSKLYGWHADLVGFYPLCDDYGLSLIGSVGVAELRLKITSYPTLLFGGAVPVNLETDTRVFSHKKYLARAGVGLQQMITECAGVRAMLNWENTNRFKRLNAKGDQAILHNASAKNSTILSFGIFYNF